MLEPETRQEEAHVPAAPPFVDEPDEARVIGLHWPTERDVLSRIRHRADHQAITSASTTWTGTNRPNVCAR